eukprot:CAMPEP_0197180620 /NCGR_PEP_ID=MMETSP1423-20130617/5172_1 /TAXON_ID=476441 /ORGANISM="Pseudo-nitzschia heimii, Strain UNC1101" /LENGTH=75 /DNA_ID=CAMNT_0042630727 /DNA_START=16 /DNA_END=240 /DNA_ORIENTATION=-
MRLQNRRFEELTPRFRSFFEIVDGELDGFGLRPDFFGGSPMDAASTTASVSDDAASTTASVTDDAIFEMVVGAVL